MSKASLWISVTPSLLEGVELINGIDEKKFPLLLSRVAQCMQNNDDLCPFSEEEEDKLLLSLNGIESKRSLKAVLDSSAFILYQAAYGVTKPAVLQKDLIELLKMTDSKADTFFNVWSNSAKGIVDRLRQKSIHDIQLDGLSWMLNVSAASNYKVDKIETRAIMELKLKQENSNAGNIVINMDQSQLYQFYNTLENIQSELDSLR
ncbi:COMM domain containing 10 protein valette [Lycorma delicatula]|uniref:COMM domain containing 10 protein valette n=1 Tax=Lycorma delicatula TaxID=130591 RepID=UPI003F51721B